MLFSFLYSASHWLCTWHVTYLHRWARKKSYWNHLVVFIFIPPSVSHTHTLTHAYTQAHTHTHHALLWLWRVLERRGHKCSICHLVLNVFSWDRAGVVQGSCTILSKRGSNLKKLATSVMINVIWLFLKHTQAHLWLLNILSITLQNLPVNLMFIKNP